MSHSFVQVPPQSTGKKVATEARYELYFSNQVKDFLVGSTVVGAVSGSTGKITGIITEGFGPASGELYLKDVTGTFTDGENIEVNNEVFAVVDDVVGPQIEYDVQKVVLTDPNNLEYIQRVDRFGATVNTFTDGSPQFGSFGSMMVGENQTIKDYRFAYDKRDDDFYDQTSGSGIISYESVTGASLLSTSTASGDLAKRTSHYYHPYAPGIGHFIEMTVRSGDNGKVGVRRRWGYFDDENGVFFELNGTDLFLVLRSNTTGTVTDTRIPQSQWNKDPLDGSDNIGFNLFPDRANIYFIDMQWLGAGRVRFGVVEPEGAKLTAHIIENANDTVIFPYMRTATLPLRVEQENIDTASSSSEFRFVCAAVKHSSKVSIQGEKQSRDSGLKTIDSVDGEVPLISFRPKQTLNGLTNRSIMKFVEATATNVSSADSGPVILRFRRNPDSLHLTGSSFTDHSVTSSAEYDVSATAIDTTNASSILSFIIGKDGDIFYRDNADRTVHNLELFLYGDGVTQPVISVTAECLTGTGAQVIAAFNWEDIKQ